MKHMLFGAALLLSGVIGFSGWTIASVYEHAGWDVFARMASSSGDIVTVAIFVLMAVMGLGICIKEWRES